MLDLKKAFYYYFFGGFCMNIAGCVVLYNPTEAILENVQSYLPFLKKLYVIDNSTKPHEYAEELKKLKKVEYVSFEGNKGIALALKKASELAIKDKFDFLLTMDQDSKFPTEDFHYLEDYIKNNDMSNVAQVCINYAGNPIKPTKDGEKATGIKVESTITSGAITNLKNYQQTEGYDDKLFIDFVDFDISCKFQAKGFDVVLFPNIWLDHNLGSVQTFNFLFFKIKTHIWPPIRQYYMFRNYYWLLNNRPEEYLKFFKGKAGINPCVKWVRILTQNHPIKNYKMIKLGRKDAKEGKLGSFEENHPNGI